MTWGRRVLVVLKDLPDQQESQDEGAGQEAMVRVVCQDRLDLRATKDLMV